MADPAGIPNNGAAVTAMSNPLVASCEAALCEYAQLKQVQAPIEDRLQRSYRDLLAKYLERCQLYDRQVETGSLWQEKARELDQQLAALKSQAAKSFILVVIDGDGAYFREDLVSAGKEGGERAAQLLYSDVKSHVEAIHPDFNPELILVHVFLHVEGLANAMAASKVIPNPALLAAFGRGLCQGNPLFSFVDVGAGKEAADHKVKKTFELMKDNVQCRHIIFGGGHDNGYATYLREFHNPTVLAKVSLLETTPIAAEFKKLRFRTVLFPGVFRTGPLPARPTSTGGALVSRSFVSHNANGASAGYDYSPIKSGESAFGPVDDQFPALPRSGHSTAVSRAQPPPPLPASSNSQSSTSPVAATGWRGRTTLPDSEGSTGSSDLPDHLLLCCNKDGQRLDRRLRPAPTAAAFNTFKDRLRKRSQKYCNQWHVKGHCLNGGNCPYTHGPRLQEPERSMLELVGRTVPCGKKSDCRNFACTWGHHCEKPGDCSYGEKACNFKRLHGMDYKPAYFEFADGRALFLEDQGFSDQCKKFGF